MNEQEKYQKISELAYAIWNRSGKPDGEKLVGGIKLKEFHWMLAEKIFNQSKWVNNTLFYNYHMRPEELEILMEDGNWYLQV